MYSNINIRVFFSEWVNHQVNEVWFLQKLNNCSMSININTLLSHTQKVSMEINFLSKYFVEGKSLLCSRWFRTLMDVWNMIWLFTKWMSIKWTFSTPSGPKNWCLWGLCGRPLYVQKLNNPCEGGTLQTFLGCLEIGLTVKLILNVHCRSHRNEP